MAEAQDVDTLKRRGRRRLVGAVALVLLAVIFLPMVFDPEPRRPAPPVSVRIPGEDESAFSPKLAPKAAPQKKKMEEKKLAEKAPESKPEPAEERQRAEAALANAEYFVQVGAFANADAITARLTEARVPYYTEKVATAKGPVTRVRAGPFASKDAAE